MQKELVFIGLGRMGAAMVEHLVEQGYTVHGFDVNAEARRTAASFGVTVYESINEAVTAMSGTKIVWMMVPSKFVDDVLNEVKTSLAKGDIIIDGGNTFFEETIERAESAAEAGIHYVDCGTSGGVTGARHGAALMVGGEKEVVDEIEHIFRALAAPDAYGHVGKTGAGHFVKMVHNGIEYGMMGAIAEGINFIESEQPNLQIDVNAALKPYKNGSIITSSLMSWMVDSFNTPNYLEQIAGEVPRGETEVEMEYIMTKDKTPILGAALEQRKATRLKASRVGTLISAMRNQFGGHATIKKG